jgi:hypothetical protein
MSKGDKLPVLKVFQTDTERFAARPIWAAFKYLECFEDDGEQARQVPSPVLQALAKCLIAFKSGRSDSLDHAFGGQTRRQWQSIKIAERNCGIALDYQRELKEAQQQPKSKRTGTPSESAYSKVAELHNMSNGSVRLIVRNIRKAHRDAAATAETAQARETSDSEQNKLPTLIMLPLEEERERELFTAMPVAAIFKYLECFNEDGEQAFEVPIHVLQALATCFAQFDRPESGPLDDAFRGQTRRQRESIEISARDQGVLFDYWDAYDRVCKQPRSERTETPSGCACAEVAERHGIRRDTVKAIFRKAGKRPVWRKGRKVR